MVKMTYFHRFHRRQLMVSLRDTSIVVEIDIDIVIGDSIRNFCNFKSERNQHVGEVKS